MPLESSIAYLRGAFVPFKEANLSIASSSVLYGMSIYTVFVVTDGKPFRLQDHYDRLCNSAKIVGMFPFDGYVSFEQFETTMTELIKRNTESNALVRVTYFIDAQAAGTKIHGLKTEMSAYVIPMKSFYGKESIDVCISSWIRVADNMIPPRAKINGSYANQCLMKNEALQKGFDEAIAMNSAGFVSEATVANIFYVKNGEIFTPNAQSDILIGITRDTVMKMKKVTEKKVTREDLYTADEIFLTGSSAGIVSVKSIDGKEIPGNTITKEISQAYEQFKRS
jgi:branched-chain amino acid aminotransferase